MSEYEKSFEDVVSHSAVDIFSEVLTLIAQAKEERKQQNIACIETAEKAAALAVAHQLHFQAAEAKLEVAAYYINVLRDYDAALHHALEAHTFLKNEHQPFLKANIYKLIGICYHWTGNFVNAVSNYLEAARILETEIPQTQEELLLAGSLHYNIILIYQHLAFEEEKFRHLEKAIEFYKKANYPDGIAKCYCLYADYHKDVKNHPHKRKEFYETALSIFKETQNKIGELSCICPLGLIYCNMGDVQNGFEWLQRGLKEMEATQVPEYIAAAHNYFARAHRYLKDYDKAIEHYIMVEELLLKNKKEVELQELYEEMASTLAESGDYKSAYDYRMKFEKVKREWINFDKATSLHNATLHFAIEKQDQETQLQQQKNDLVQDYIRQLEISNNELRQIAYVASHDLREPLRMINSYSMLLEKYFIHCGDPEAIEYTSVIHASAKRMYEMIQDMMSLSKANAELSLQDVSLNELLNEVKSVLSIIVSNKNARIESENLPNIRSDKTLLFQVFQNLISNAVKYNKSPQPLVKIQYLYAEGKHCFSLHDNGIGIPASEREKVFYIFNRLHKESGESGSGIGLAVCKKAIEKLGGKIWIEDSYLGGTAIQFYLPDTTNIKEKNP
jgi:signal transduction histidine kinase